VARWHDFKLHGFSGNLPCLMTHMQGKLCGFIHYNMWNMWYLLTPIFLWYYNLKIILLHHILPYEKSCSLVQEPLQHCTLIWAGISIQCKDKCSPTPPTNMNFRRYFIVTPFKYLLTPITAIDQWKIVICLYCPLWKSSTFNTKVWRHSKFLHLCPSTPPI
jgi:hypothetical protein